MATSNMKLSSLLVSRIKSFLISYRDEMKNRPSPQAQSSSTSSASFLSSLSSNVPDPTTANAFNTSTVVLRKRTSKKKNSPIDGVPLSNYRIRTKDVPAEVFDWICHYLWLKKCPIELATVVAIHVSSKMNEPPTNDEDVQSSKEIDLDALNNGIDHKSPTLMMMMDTSTTSESPLNNVPSSLDTILQSTDRSSLPSALCSHDVARQSRELMNDYLEELGSNPDQAITMVQDYLENPNNNNNNNGSAFPSSVHAMKNRRLSMEDRHVIIHNLNKALNLDLPKTYSYYAVFDGHAGIDAASYSTAHLHHYLVESEAFHQGNMEQAFREAFEKTDQLYIKRCKEDGIDKLRPSGTTAICALVEDNKTVYMAWAGDSQAVLVRNGCPEEIMLPHKPDLDSERIRIQDHGGFVTYSDTWRVNGILSVTRAIGDPEFKPSIIAEPSFSSFEIDPSLDFLVIGCDGLFDNLTGQDITSYVFEFLCKNENKEPEKVIHDVSEYLAQQAVNEGSQDNITSIVIFFKPFEQLVSTGFSTDNIVNHDEEMNNCLDSGLSTMTNIVNNTLPIINGGHFPYTDFAELPIGTNFKLTTSPEFMEDTAKFEPPEAVQQPQESFDDADLAKRLVNNNFDGMTYLKESEALNEQPRTDSKDMDENVEIVKNPLENGEHVEEAEEEKEEEEEAEDEEGEEEDVDSVVVVEDLDSGEDERCQDEFDFVRTTVDEKQQKPDNDEAEIVVVELDEEAEEEKKIPQQPVTEVEPEIVEELNVQSSMIEVEKPAIMEMVTNDDDDDNHHNKTHLDNNSNIEQPPFIHPIIDEPHGNEFGNEKTMITTTEANVDDNHHQNNDDLNMESKNDDDKMTLSDGGNQNDEKSAEIHPSPIVMNESNPFTMDFNTMAANADPATVVFADEKQANPLLFKDDNMMMMKNASNDQIAKDIIDLHENGLTSGSDDINVVQQQPISNVENGKLSNVEDFCYVNSIKNNEFDMAGYPIKDMIENNSGLEIPSQLLNETQLESALYDHQENTGVSNNLMNFNDNFNNQDLLDLQQHEPVAPTPTATNEDVSVDDQTANIMDNFECSKQPSDLTSNQEMPNFDINNLVSETRSLNLNNESMIENSFDNNSNWLDDNNLTVVENTNAAIIPESIQPIEPIDDTYEKMADNTVEQPVVQENFITEPTNETAKIPESNETLVSQNAEQQQNSTSDIDFNISANTGDNLIDLQLSKPNEELKESTTDDLKSETMVELQNDIDQAIKNVTDPSTMDIGNVSVENDTQNDKLVANNMAHIDEIKEVETVPIESLEQQEKIVEEIEPKKMEQPPETEKAKTVDVDKKLPSKEKVAKNLTSSISKLTSKTSLSKISTTLKTASPKVPSSNVSAKPAPTAATRTATTKTVRKSVAAVGASKVSSSTRPISSTLSSRLTTAKPSSTTTRSTSALKPNEAKKPATSSVASKLNTRPTTARPAAASSSSTSTARPSTVTATQPKAAPSTRTSLLNRPGPGTKAPVPQTTTTTKPAASSTTSKPTTTRVPLTRPATKLNTAPKASGTTAAAAAKKPATGSAVSKIGSFRTAGSTTTSATNKAQTVNKASSTLKSSSTTTTTASKPLGIKSNLNRKVNGSGDNNNTQNDTKKPVASNQQKIMNGGTKTGGNTSTTATHVSAITKPPTAHKRTNLINVENSLKQELEDAVMNEMNAAAAANNNNQQPQSNAENAIF